MRTRDGKLGFFCCAVAVCVVCNGAAITLTDGVGGTCEVSAEGAKVMSWRPSGCAEVVESVMPAWPWFGMAGLPGSNPDGFAHRSQFKVRSQSSSAVTLVLQADETNDSSWDRRAECEITVELTGETLSMTMKTTNIGMEPILLTDGLRARFRVVDRANAVILGGVQELRLDDQSEQVYDDLSHAWRIVEPSSARMIRVALHGSRKAVVRASIPEICTAIPTRDEAVVLLPGEVKVMTMVVTVCAKEESASVTNVNPNDYRIRTPGNRCEVNEHLHVLTSVRTGDYLAFWTQETWEGSSDMHIVFAKSRDRGLTWTEPRFLWGAPSEDSGLPGAAYQVPMVSRSGRIYCVWAQCEEPGRFASKRTVMAACSDDDGETWTEPVKLAEASNWCVWQRPLRLATGGRYITAISIAEERLTKTRFLRFENIDDDPDPKDIRYSIVGDGTLEGEEASLVKLPDGRLFAVMRSRFGSPLWTESRDGGETWTKSLPMRDATGALIRHPRSPCPMYDLEGDDAASGHCLAFFTDTYNPELQQFFGRGPLYLYRGEFDPCGAQPIRFTKGPILLRRVGDDRYGNSCYSSFTVSGGKRILWYPDMKHNLLGVNLDPWLGTNGGEPELALNGVTVNGRKFKEVDRRVEADGIAMRYRLPDGRRIVSGEDTFWKMSLDAVCWYQEGPGAYENAYTQKVVRDIPVGTKANLPITFRNPDGTYRMITEANLVDYTDLAVEYVGEGKFRAFYYAEDDKPFEQTGTDTTPWRVVIVARDLNALVNSDLVRRLCPPPGNARSVALHRPGRCIWQWLPSGDPKYAEQKEWYDRTKALGFEYYLIDDGWKNWRDGDKDQWECLKSAIDYGKSIGVETAMWVDSKEMPDGKSRRTYLERVVRAGAVGIKIDFIPRCDSKWCKWYEETLRDTAELGLFVDFHGAVKPTGRERTWPHELAREAIRGHEWHVTRYNRVLPLEHDTVLPFCRLVQGHADYTPVVFEQSQLIHFTWPRQLAQGIIMSCPFLCFGDYPKNYQESPMLEIVRAMPSEYDETVVLPGSEIGECVAMAKRKGNMWFVAVENGSLMRTLEIRFSFLGTGGWKLVGFRDNLSGRLDAVVREECSVVASDAIKATIRPGGGYVAMLQKQQANAF